ncbi:MAG: hypothetical protein V4581_13275 [Bacteroidota bacterium]
MKKVTLLLLLTAFSLLSCKTVRFTKQQLAWFNVYNKKDVLVFQSLRTQQKDTTVILRKQVFFDFDPWLHPGTLPQVARMKYHNKNLTDTYVKYEDYMFYEFARSKGNNSLNYLNTIFTLRDTIQKRDTQLSISGKTFTNAYRLTATHGKGSQPQVLYWDTQYGILKYVTFDGEMWERINW